MFLTQGLLHVACCMLQKHAHLTWLNSNNNRIIYNIIYIAKTPLKRHLNATCNMQHATFFLVLRHR